ncbi:GTP cyclohydrolase I FolE [Hydrocarboniphaga sp.]|uniref:GTP cyclohydrolase I FolE n=1 Tax=Hydrocarboniphaga sp. TaxID=2033016 RepID=UPI003D119AE1
MSLEDRPDVGSGRESHPLASLYRQLLAGVGEDLDRQGLAGTPLRAAKAFEFLTHGYSEDVDRLLNGAIFDSANRDMVVVRDIEFYSLCEHHILPFHGKVHVAYLPAGKVIGLSKIPRIVDVFARRLQIQENLTDQIARCIERLTRAKGVAVVIEARHLCMAMRGVEKQNASMVTTTMLGQFRESESARTQFLRFLPNA